MRASPPAAPRPAGDRRPAPVARRTGRLRLSPLARDIAVVLIVKAALLGLLWYAFFRTPVAPGMAMPPDAVAARLIGEWQREVTRAVP